MSFTGLEFLFFFFPIALAVNFLLPVPAGNYWLLAASLFFYIVGEPAFFGVLLCSILINYAAGLLLETLTEKTAAKGRSGGKTAVIRKVFFVFILLLNFDVLFLTKYLNIITSIIRLYIPMLESRVPQTSIVMPLAVSFFTFQSVSYIIDIFRGMPAEKNPCSYALYICFFPQMIQGPIIRYGDFLPQMKNRKVTAEGFADGVIRFLTGLNQKVLLANALAGAADAAFRDNSVSIGMAWLGMLAYSLQLYFDFAGYSDMAVGLGKMFGFSLPENFDFPYTSKSISEFWRRWHITLGTWFRDYLYFPLGGSRSGSKARIALNLMIVWLATGIWHGAGLTFILWGLLHGAVIVFEKLTGLPKRLEKRKVLQFLYRGVVLFTAMFGWMLFRSRNFGSAVAYVKALFYLNGISFRDGNFLYNSREYIFIMIIAVIAAFPLLRNIRARISERGEKAASAVRILWYLIQVILAVLSLSCLVLGSHDPFLYVKF